MYSVGDQRQAAGKDAADDLRDRQAHVDRDGGEDATVACLGIDVVMVAMTHSDTFRFVTFQDIYDLQRL